ncbi:hypothetical protein I6N96_16505 [Enterococcus sp. BWM-S5]|uniref:CDI immunity protein domain-containing protein n=1 Tax=Enterococcus larvae TaxID=2794352 RepID=A0ABS4CMT8_9ENTE|nr:hypothetical protein [Enterococcus larvae]MBP1047894.1 hypothetical protein [Enterococcus larvae]
MEKEFHILEEKKSIDELMSTYFNFINRKYLKRALEYFANKEGFGREIVFVSFQSDLDDYDMAQLSLPLDDKRVLVELGAPAVEVDQIAYLDFETFYSCLDRNVKTEIEKNPDDSELLELLEKVKQTLNI